MHGILLLLLDLEWCFYCDDLLAENNTENKPIGNITIRDLPSVTAVHKPRPELEGKRALRRIKSSVCQKMSKCHSTDSTYPRIDAGTRSILASGSATSSST